MKKTPSKSSPRGGKRGCLCPDGKYSKDCCNGDLEAQGIGSLVQQGTQIINNVNVPRTING